MGMSASQARFLCLTARKNNVEFEGQQINQQRTTLSNESASYYSELCNLVVPTPPSVDDYTKVSYTFDDGALTNTITTMIAKPNNRYSISYIQQWQDDYSIVASASSVVAKSDDGYKIGSSLLRQLGQGIQDSNGDIININGKIYSVQEDDLGLYVEKTEAVESTEECTQQEVAKIENYMYDFATGGVTQVFKDDNDGSFYKLDENGARVAVDVSDDELVMCIFDDSSEDAEDAVTLVTQDSDGKYFKQVTKDVAYKHYLTESEKLSVNSYTDPYIASLTDEQRADLLEQENYYRIMLNEKVFNNPNSDQQWYVRYIQNSTTGAYVPYFYNMNEVQSADYFDGFAASSVNCYSIGSSTKTKEVINALGSVEKDATGRYVSLILYHMDSDGNVMKDSNGMEVFTQYSLTTNTCTDEDAYNDAMNQYSYAQHKYDQKIQEINSKIEVVQQQDKELELKLKQLDTEENAIQTEMEAVKKVISKNVESSFKTFSA